MTRRGWSTTGWMLTALACVLALVGGEYAWRTLIHPSTTTVRTVPDEFKPVVGEAAKDFGLPGEDKKTHRLSDYKGREYVLTFFCGCGECNDFAKKLARTYKDSGKAVPTVSVFTPGWSPKDGTGPWIKRTGAQFTYLYTKEHPEVIDLWEGTPCPKAYVIGVDGRIKYASPPPTQKHNDAVVADIAQIMGLRFTPSKEKPGPAKKAEAGMEQPVRG